MLSAAVCLALVAAPAHADELAGYRGLPLAPGVTAPRPAAPGTVWRQFEAVPKGSLLHDAHGNFALQVLGTPPQGPILCEIPHDLPSTLGLCVGDGGVATHLGWAPASDVVTFDPVIAFFAPSLRVWHSLELRLDQLGLSSR